MKMYCPRCGTGDQEAESYCRNCGDFLLDYSGRSVLVSKLFGGSAPTTQITVGLVLDLVTVLASFLLLGFLNGHYDALRERTGEAPPAVIYLVYAFLIAISIWQFFGIVVGLRLRSKLSRKKERIREGDGLSSDKSLSAKKTREILPSPGNYETVPLSVTEDPTKILEKVKRK